MSADAIGRRPADPHDPLSHHGQHSPNPLAGVELSNTVRGALDLARHRTGPHGIITTAAVFATLQECDGHGRWDRLQTAHGAEIGPDPAEPPILPAPDGAVWNGVALSPALAASLTLLPDLSAAYDLRPVPAGALALALACEPTSSVVAAFAAAGIPHRDLLAMVQDELLGTDLEGLDEWVSTRWAAEGATAGERAVRRARAAARAENRVADDIDLLHGLSAEIPPAGKKPFPPKVVLDKILDDAAAPAKRLPTRSVDDVLATVPPENHADEWELTAAVATTPSPACSAVFEVGGMTAAGVAADALSTRDERAGVRWRADPVHGLVMVVNTILMLVVAGLVVAHAIGPGSWWELLLAPLAFVGPFASPFVPPLVAVAFALLVSPVAAGLQVLRVVLDQVQNRLDRRKILAHTGVALTYGECRRHLARRLRPARQVAWSLLRAGPRLERLRARVRDTDR